MFGSWEVRSAFDEAYGRTPHILIAEDRLGAKGFIALSHIAEEGYFGAFPGETWNGRTWLEQNLIPAHSPAVTRSLWEAVPDDTVLRYLRADTASHLGDIAIDETGYVFIPSRYDFSFDEYWNSFSGKSRKRLTGEISALGDYTCGPSSNTVADLEWMFRVNLANFGDCSYFSDPRFMSGFEKMLSHLSAGGNIELTAVRIGGQTAAVDVAALVDGQYTVLAGATSPEFPGVAKIINLYHIRLSCERRSAKADFLCGDFGWKERFHLSPEDLYVKCAGGADARIATAGEG